VKIQGDYADAFFRELGELCLKHGVEISDGTVWLANRCFQRVRFDSNDDQAAGMIQYQEVRGMKNFLLEQRQEGE
jgi:hypothetical protein